jgi:hypothetical protein
MPTCRMRRNEEGQSGAYVHIGWPGVCPYGNSGDIDDAGEAKGRSLGGFETKGIVRMVGRLQRRVLLLIIVAIVDG